MFESTAHKLTALGFVPFDRIAWYPSKSCGFIQTDIVHSSWRLRDGSWGISTKDSLNSKAEPYLPGLKVALSIVPSFPNLLKSRTNVSSSPNPLLLLKFMARTKS